MGSELKPQERQTFLNKAFKSLFVCCTGGKHDSTVPSPLPLSAPNPRKSNAAKPESVDTGRTPKSVESVHYRKNHLLPAGIVISQFDKNSNKLIPLPPYLKKAINELLSDLGQVGYPKGDLNIAQRILENASSCKRNGCSEAEWVSELIASISCLWSSDYLTGSICRPAPDRSFALRVREEHDTVVEHGVFRIKNLQRLSGEKWLYGCPERNRTLHIFPFFVIEAKKSSSRRMKESGLDYLEFVAANQLAGSLSVMLKMLEGNGMGKTPLYGLSAVGDSFKLFVVFRQSNNGLMNKDQIVLREVWDLEFGGNQKNVLILITLIRRIIAYGAGPYRKRTDQYIRRQLSRRNNYISSLG
ncbi:hypothetical protein NEOLI_001557 [Neolecta irregularis DAH-3]|uniref:Uncharacterized protein n=1 Tax=Neolecta irregularis (strain DAH-3) TaxID=1198029 RepID=A0A1U7LQ77_NEOID|nr:hypothetical protein NEOLI_001557 [Neolecta irregularis DAH-3]|eukprot:OLL24807.1 hypothetical protein NEOLI_001557 [Neolecta irregularis DAH-3]